MLSKDHFSNILNEPAGKVASQVLKWVVPQLISCWDDERIDVNRTLNRIIAGVFHHPALRDHGDDGAVDGRRLMFDVVQQWWESKPEQERQIMRDQLSRDGVEQGRNHKEGVQDTGHGCRKPLGMRTVKTAQSSGTVGGLAGGLAGQSKYDAGYTGSGGAASGGLGKFAEEALGSGAIGGLLGGLAGKLGGELLGAAFEGPGTKKQSHETQHYEPDGSYTQTVIETGHSQPQYSGGQQKYGQVEYSQTAFVEGGQRQQYQRYEQDDEYGRSGYGEQVIRECRPTYGGGYEETTETRYERPGGGWESQVRVEGRETTTGGYYEETKRFSGHDGYERESNSEVEVENDNSYRQRDRQRAVEQEREREREHQRQQERARYEAYQVESRYQEPRPIYESVEHVAERPVYEGEGGSAEGSEGIERREGYAEEEQGEEYGDDRGYDGGGEY